MILIMDIIANATHRQDLIEEAEVYRRLKDANIINPLFPRRDIKETVSPVYNRPENVQV